MTWLKDPFWMFALYVWAGIGCVVTARDAWNGYSEAWGPAHKARMAKIERYERETAELVRRAREKVHVRKRECEADAGTWVETWEFR